MSDLPQNATRERIMDTAEKLFMSRGFNTVKLRDIADEVGMKHASLYYYVPKGKEQLFAEVVRRGMRRHSEQMALAIDEAGDHFPDQIYAISDYMIAQPPIDLARMLQVDLNELPAPMAEQLKTLVIDSLNEPLIATLKRATARGVADVDEPMMASMALLTTLQGLHHVPLPNMQARQAFGRKLVDMILYGWLSRH